MSAVDTLLVTATGDVHLHQLDPTRHDQMRGLVDADRLLLLALPPTVGLALYVDEAAYAKRLRLNLAATFLAHPHFDPILGDALLLGLDLDGHLCAVPEDFLSMFDHDLA